MILTFNTKVWVPDLQGMHIFSWGKEQNVLLGKPNMHLYILQLAHL